MASINTIVKTLRDGKAQLRRERISAPLDEKFQDLLRAQRLYVDIVGSQRALLPWQRPWNITGYITTTVVITDNSIEQSFPNYFTAHQATWIRPKERWKLPVPPASI